MKFHHRAAAGLLVAATVLFASAIAAERPNIVVIMSDDMGYSDLGCYGGEIETPNIDRLAAAGLRFTNYHGCNMCVPTRASLLTGLYQTTARRDNRISSHTVTIAEVLSQAGYTTAMTGKWHASAEDDRENWPPQRGFQRYFGTIGGAGSFFAPYSLMRGNRHAEDEFLDPDFYYTTAISDNAVRYIEEAAADAPLFLYVAYTAAHWPLHALEEDIAKYKGRYAMGWDELRRRRHKRMLELGVVRSEWPLSPRHPDVPAWSDEPNKAWQERRMEVYAAQVDVMDRGIGRIVSALDAAGRLENTLLMFTIDNGGCHVEYTPNRKGAYLPEKTRDGRPVRPGNVPDIMPGAEDTYQSYGHGWANAGNTPFRLFKQFSHEGGVHLPLIVHWPNGLTTGPGELTDQLSHVIDIMPTCLDAAGAKYPGTFAGRQIHPVDGLSLVPILKGTKRPGHDFICWDWAKGRAVQQGRWRLVAVKNKPWELYDVEADRTELVDLAERMPDKAKHLESLWTAWSERTRGLE